jgi:hypothetical protein
MPLDGRLSYLRVDKGVTDRSGILIRLLVKRSGEPFGIKAEANQAEPELVAQTGRLSPDLQVCGSWGAGGKQAYTFNCRVIFK